MLKIEVFKVNSLEENCYVVSDDTKECAIIDCGASDEEEWNDIKEYIEKNGLKPVKLLATHGHFDHNIGNTFALRDFGLKVEVHHADQALIEDLAGQIAKIMGVYSPDVTEVPVGRYFHDKDIITIGNTDFTIIETPGHSPGSVFIYSEKEKVAFSGDTLFRGSIGRTDFIGGSMFQIIQSLRMICQLPDDIVLYPGHGPSTSIGYECKTNMYLDR